MPRAPAIVASRVLAAATLCLCTAAWAVPACSIAIGSVAFGAYSTLAATPRETVGSVSVTCSDPASGNVTYSIALSAGGGSFAPRQMSSGPNLLAYNLYRDPARSLVWGDGSAGSSILADGYPLSVVPATRAYPVYGRISAGQGRAHVGSYADSITVTVTY